MSPPDVIVASGMKQGSVTVSEIRDDDELTPLAAISVFSDSTYINFISKNKTSEKRALEAQQLFGSHDHPIRMALKTFITEILFLIGLKRCSLCE
jgi:recombinational DNA repair protein RecT